MDSPEKKQGLPSNEGVQDILYTELWRACAGSFVYVPRVDDRVFYFPQGHLEQVAAYTQNQPDSHLEIPVYDLPSKILCKIMNVELKAEAYSDEVYAQVTLVPEVQKDNLCFEEEVNIDQIPSRNAAYSFSKILTPSDTSTHGGFSVPKKYADECFPPLDMTLQTPAQEIVAKDLNGFEWRFRHIYREKLVNHCRGESGELRVGIRRAAENLSNISQSSSLISGHSMQLGILTNASNAVGNRTMFLVQWDAIVEDKMHPERVCPWWIEPLESAKEKKQVPALPTKKKGHALLNQRSLPGISGFGKNDVHQNSAGPSSQTRRADGDLQGQDYSGLSPPQPLQRAPSTDIIRPSKVPIRGSRFGKENRNQHPFLKQDPLHKSLGRSMSLTHEDLSITSSNLTSIGSESLGMPSTESRDENDAPFGQPGSSSTFKLFGVNLIDSSPEIPSVLKLGNALGRAVDLARFNGYTELIAELDSMFDFQGTLISGGSGWHVTCLDDEGDMMQLGDYPWQDFLGVVQKMIICPKEGTDNLKPGSSANP
ncbi:hypothetical protein JHK87_007940 [Glycine soja]|nr:hypothetical protein JHK87_007940 [Glycine soja]